MINPAEEIVNVWLQEFKHHFTMSNLVVPQLTRHVNGRRVGGGRGKEIDFLSTDGRGNYYWIEVSVSPNPRLPGGASRSTPVIIQNAVSKFTSEKEKWLQNKFAIKRIIKWYVYSPKLFTFFSKDKKLVAEKKFQDNLRERKIEAISFGAILKEVFDGLNYMGYDTTRQYLFLLKKFREVLL